MHFRCFLWCWRKFYSSIFSYTILKKFAGNCNKVYANDISQSKITIAQNNVKVYNAESKITFLNKNVLLLDKTKDLNENLDIIFISPPWGGVTYSKEKAYNLEHIKPKFEEILRKALSLADNVVMFLPRNIDITQLANFILKQESLFYASNHECIVTIEALIYGGKDTRAILLFVGPLFKVIL